MTVLGRLDEAKQFLQDWAKSDPRAFEARYELARISTLYKPPATTDALQYLQEALTIMPEAVPVRLLDSFSLDKTPNISCSPKARLMLVDILVSINEASQAIPHLVWLIEKADSTDARYKLGQIYSSMQNWDEALVALKKAVELDDLNGMVR